MAYRRDSPTPVSYTHLGATVLQKGTNNGIVTGLDGKFTLTLSNKAEQTLLISMIGFIEQSIGTKLYDTTEALELCVKTGSAKFDESVEVHVKLGVDSRHADQQVRGAIVLPLSLIHI